MPRPRFDKLPQAQQDAILTAALAEFAALGYTGASLNRIIQASGISKGSMYYYFDGKEDLYVHVIRVQLEGLIRRSGPSGVPDAATPGAFWANLEAYYLRLMRMLAASPSAAALLRDWLSGSAPPLRGIALHEAQRDAEQAAMPWLARAVAAGQEIGAVRTDIPPDLILAVAMGMGQAMDTWLIARDPEDVDLPDAVHTVIDMMRRSFSPG